MCRHPDSPLVVIISRDWQSRALLRAQLLEEGLQLRAYLSAADARALASGTDAPALIVADLSGSTDDVDALSALAGRTPVWVIASRASTPGAAELRGRGFEAVFFRPMRLGELARLVKQRLGETG